MLFMKSQGRFFSLNFFSIKKIYLSLLTVCFYYKNTTILINNHDMLYCGKIQGYVFTSPSRAHWRDTDFPLKSYKASVCFASNPGSSYY